MVSAQFDGYRRIVAESPDRKTTERYMDTLMIYQFGGWAAFLGAVNKSQEEK